MVLVELCAGSAAISCNLLGTRSLMGYMGGKNTHAGKIIDALEVDRPDRVVLVDPGPWGRFWAEIPTCKDYTLSTLDRWSPRDQVELWHELKSVAVPVGASYCATFMILQGYSFSFKPIGIDGHAWKTQGIGVQTAMGLPSTQRFGGVKPQLPAYIARLQALDVSRIEGVHGSATEVEPIPGSLCYIDPPYKGTTGYHKGIDLTREQVEEIAIAWAQAGKVAISEGEPVLWDAVPIGGSHRSAMSKARTEWLSRSWSPSQIGMFGAR